MCVKSKCKKEFYLDRKVALLCNYFAKHFTDSSKTELMLDDIDSNTLEIILQYLHFKSKYHHITDET